MTDNTTIVALSTPPGTSAIGVIRLSGEQAIEIADEAFFGCKLANQSSHTVHYGFIKDGEETIDEVMVAIFKAPKTYTKENLVEISCHGSPYIENRIIQLLIDKGARSAKAGEFTLRAFLNGRIDLSQAEAVADLIASESASAHDIAINQMRGGFSSEIQKLREELIHFAAMIELELDFSEEDVEFANRDELMALIDKIQVIIRQLIDSFKLGNVIKNGVPTVIAGRPNAGKSTLLNALLKEDRAIVSEIPGTTRDTIEETLNIEGINFRLIDTAGIRDAADKIEAIGVEKTMEKIRQSALMLYIFDVTELSSKELQADLEKLQHEGITIIVIGNKIDLLQNTSNQNEQPQTISNISNISNTSNTSNISNHLNQFKDSNNIIYISSKQQANLQALKDHLVNSILTGNISTDQTIVTNARHYDALMKADHALQEVVAGIDHGVSGELMALDIRRALEFLGEITGEVTTEDLLGEIFGKFCIGK